MKIILLNGRYDGGATKNNKCLRITEGTERNEVYQKTASATLLEAADALLQ